MVGSMGFVQEYISNMETICLVLCDDIIPFLGVMKYQELSNKFPSKKMKKRRRKLNPVDQSQDQPVDQSQDQPVDQSQNQPVDQSQNQPVDQSQNQLASQVDLPVRNETAESDISNLEAFFIRCFAYLFTIMTYFLISLMFQSDR